MNKKEKSPLGKAIERDMEEIKQGKSKLYSEKEFQKKFSYLKKFSISSLESLLIKNCISFEKHFL